MSDTTVQTPVACCGPDASTAQGVEPQAVDPVTPAPCCGTTAGAEAAGACCDPAAKTEAVTAGAGCCG